MSDKYGYRYKLEGMDCADCAINLEETLNARPDGKTCALVNFTTNTLITNHEDVEELNQMIKKIDPNVRAVLKDDFGSDNEQSKTGYAWLNRKLALIIVSFVLLILGVTINDAHGWQIKWGLYLSAYLLVGFKVIKKATLSIFHNTNFLNEQFLMVLATVGAFAINELSEGVAVMLFYSLGEYLQELAVNKSRREISAILKIRPDKATRLDEQGNEEIVNPRKIKPGEIIVVKVGERVPLDGKIIKGTTQMDTSALTGESRPRKIGKGEVIPSGVINLSQVVNIEVQSEFEESTVSKILRLVEMTSARKAKTELFITKFARYYVPFVVISALLIAFIPPLILSEPITKWVYRALVLLVISCPCALVISVPLSYFAGVGKSSTEGVLIKGSSYLEALSSTKIVAFDKTGTITYGKFKVSKVTPYGSFTRQEVLEKAALAEIQSNHPIALSIKGLYGQDLKPKKIESYTELHALGVITEIDGEELIVGNDRILHQAGIVHEPHLCTIKGTVVHLAIDRKYAGYLIIEDQVKKGMKKVVSNLKKKDIKLVMLTGDHQDVAMKVAEEIGFTEEDKIYSELLPWHKVELVEELLSEKKENETLVFVGDGINDAPVLARADIGVAMGGLGSDAAVEAADVVLMGDKPEQLVKAIDIAQATKKIVWQNIFMAIGIKVAVMGLGIVGLATMWEAVFADVGVTLITVANSLRLLKK